jgi:chromosome segregation and condensation protein ScpB
MNEKNYEAIIEAILFTMGESVELDKIAAAIELDKKETKDHLASRGGNFRTEQSFFAAVRSTLLRRRIFAPESNRLLANGRSNPLKEP